MKYWKEEKGYVVKGKIAVAYPRVISVYEYLWIAKGENNCI